MTAFAAVMLVLMYLMMFAPYVEYSGVSANARYASLDLPKTFTAVEQPAARREDAVFVAIQRDGRIWVNESRLIALDDTARAEEFKSKINEALRHSGVNTVYINADYRAKYGSVAETIEAIHATGVQDIVFIADKYREPLATSH